MNSTAVVASVIVLLIVAIAASVTGLAMPYWLRLEQKIFVTTLHIVAGLWRLCIFITPSNQGTKCMDVEDYYDKVEVLLDIVRTMQISSACVGLLCLLFCIIFLAVRRKRPQLASIFLCLALSTAFLAATLAAVGVTTFGIKERKTKNSKLYWAYDISVGSGVLFLISGALLVSVLLKYRRDRVTDVPYTIIN